MPGPKRQGVEMARRWAEFSVIFLLPPLLIAEGWLPRSAVMPVLWVVFLYSAVMLRHDGMALLERPGGFHRLRELLPRMTLITAAIGLFTWGCYPERFFLLVREQPLLWAAVLLLYPIFSVIPQEITFRRFFYHRYRMLFGRAALWANALLFAYIHIVFGNIVAVAFTFVGGALFALTYERSRSVLLVSVEHACYGLALYTFGLGNFFYHNGGY